MIRKLLSRLFSSKTTEKQVPTDNDVEFSSLSEAMKAVELNLDTGKLKLPDNLTDTEKAELDAAMKELQQSLQQLNKDAFQSLEQFLADPKNGTSLSIPFTTANNLPDAQSQVVTEMLENKEDTDHWSDEDFIEALFGYYNGGYMFEGIEVLNNKLNEGLELSQDEKKRVRDWYMLATQELVYAV
jgi:hypothetical protein